MSDSIYVSKEGLEKLKAELTHLTSERLRLADVIEAARELGDLKENAEYHSAKEAQAMTQAKIRVVESNIARSEIFDDKDVDASKACLGATVRVLNKKTKKEVTYMLTSHVESDLAAGKISTQSPVGKALLGKSVGDVAVASVPAGDIE